MAVAADFHRDFLIPEQLSCPTTQKFCDDLRLFFCWYNYITPCPVFQALSLAGSMRLSHFPLRRRKMHQMLLMIWSIFKKV